MVASGCSTEPPTTQSTAPPPVTAAAAPPVVSPIPATPNDYRDPANWLCRPNGHDACAVDLDTTSIDARGQLTREKFKPAANAPVDCFYVYPTISNDPAGNSTMKIAPEDLTVIRQQFARLSANCRVFAPKYRQVTLAALRSYIIGKPIPVDRDLAYRDVLDAWNAYLAHDNAGRGVVLVGHSQGSGQLTRLMREEIDGKPVQSKLISAFLMGTNLAVPAGKTVGGAFNSIPLCQSSAQTGCVIAFASFRADAPPPANTRFGKVPEAGMKAACVNPAAPGGAAAALKPYFSSRREAVAASLEAAHWLQPTETIETPFVTLPKLLYAQCVSDSNGDYLAISAKPTKADKRRPFIPGDLIVQGAIQKDWGLHLVDVNLVMGNVMDLISTQSKAYLSKIK